MKHLMLSLGLFFIGSLSAQSVSYSPNQSIYCGASGQIVFSLDYNPNDSSKVYWTTNASFATFKLGIGGVDTLDWNGLITPQSVSIYVSDSSASPIFLDTLLLNFAPFPNPTLSIGSSFEKCSGSKTVTATPAGGQFYLDGQAITLISGGQLDINGLDLGTHSLRYEVTSGGCTADITESFNITGFVFAPGQSSNIMFGEIFSSNFVPMSGTMYGGQLLFRKCSAVSGATFEIQTTGTFSQFTQIEIDWGDANITSQALSSSIPLAHSYTQAGMYDISVELSSSSNTCSLDTTFKVFFGANPNLNTGFVSSQNCILPGEDSILVEHIALYNFLNDINGYEYWFYSQIGGDTVKMKAPLVANGVPQYPNYLRLDDTLWYSHPFYEGSCGLPASNNKSNYYEVTVQLFSPCGSSFQILGPTPVTEAPNAGIIGPNQGCLNAEIEFDSHDSSGALVLAGNSPGTYNCSDTHVGVWMILAENGDTILPSSNIYTVQPGSSLGDVIGPLVNPAFWTLGTNVLKVVFHQPGYYKIVRTASLYDWERQNHVPCGLAMDTLEICIDEVPVAEFTNVLTDSVCTLDTLSANLLLDSINCSKLTTYRLDLYKGSVLVQNLLNSDTMHSTSFYAPGDYGEYFLKGTVSNDCGDSTVIDTFYVFEPVEVVPIETSSSYCRDSIVLEIDTNLFRVNTDSSNARLDSIQVNPSSGWEILASGEYRFNTYGTYNIKVFYKGFCNIDSAQCQLVLNAPPLAEFAISDSSGCSPFIPAISLLSNNVNYTHLWYVKNSIGAIVDSSFLTIPSFTLWNSSNTFDSTFTILHYVFDGTSSCIDSAYIPVYVYPDPSAGFSLPLPICARDTVTVTDTSTGYGLNYRWFASGGVVISDTTVDEPMLFFPDNQAPTADSTYTITVIVTSDDGCKDTAVQNVLIHARPKANFGIDSVQCGSYAGVLTDSSQFNGSGPLNYSWSVIANISGAGAATLSSTSAASPTLSIPTPSVDSVTYRVTLVVTDSYGCTDEYLDSIKLYARPTATFSITPTDTCEVFDLTGKITDTSTNGFSTNTTAGIERRWLVERDNTLLYDSIRTSLDYVLTNTGVDDSVYTITLMVTNERGCMDSSSVDVTIYPDARAGFIVKSSLFNCAPFIVDTSVISAFEYPHANDTYTWNVYDSLSGSLVYGPVNGKDSLSFMLPAADSTVVIVLTTSNANGCSEDSDTLIIGTLPNPEALFSFSQDTACAGDSIYMSLITGNAQTTYDWYIDTTGNGMQYLSSGFSSFLTSLGNNGDTVLNQIQIKCVANQGSTGCSDSTTLPLYVRPNPVPSFAQNLVCGLDTVELNGITVKNSLIQSWNWELGSSFLMGQKVNKYYGTAGYYNVILGTTTYDGCSRQVMDSIVVYDYPTADIAVSSLCAPDTICSGETIVFNDSSQTLGALQGIINSWGWDLENDGITESTLQNFSTSLNGYGFIDVELLVSNQFGCSDSIVKSAFIQVEPQANIQFALDTTCAPWQTSYVVQDTGYIDSSYFVLSALNGSNSIIVGEGEIIDSVVKTLQPNYLTDSIFTIAHTVWNCCGSSTDFDSIYLKTPPLADYATVPDTGCTPLTVTFVLQNRIRGNAIAAVLDFGNGRIDTITPQPVVSPSGIVSIWPSLSETYIYGGTVDTTYYTFLTVWNNCGDSTYSSAVNVRPNTVDALIDAPSTKGCAPFTVDFENLTSGANDYSWCFDWDGTTCTGGGSNSFEPSWTYSIPGTYVVAMFADNGCGYDTAYLEIEVNPSPTSMFTHNTPVCAKDSLILTNTSTVTSGFISVNQWTLDSLTTSQNQDLSYVITQGGSYEVSLMVESSNGCSDSSFQLVSINHNPEVNFSLNNACLNEQPVQFYDSTLVQGASINYTYWDFGDGNASVGLNPTHTYSQPGTYQVKLIKGSSQGCIDSMVQTITIYDVPETQFRAVLTSGDSCSVPQTYAFQNITPGAQAFLWDFDYLNAPGQYTSSQSTPSFTYVNSGVYLIRLVSYNAFGCTDTAYQTVVVNDGVVADFHVSPVNGCEPLTLNLYSQPIFNRQLDTISHVHWELSNGWTNNTTDSVSSVTIDQPGQYALSYFVYTNQGCSDSIIGQIINVYPTPEPDFIMSKVDIRTFDFINNGVYLDTTLQFLWSFGDGDTSNVFSPRHRYLQTTMMDSLQVCLIVRNSFNCFESICKPIFMWDYNLSVPNSIVPERTQFGEDALFLPKGHDLMNYTLSIFDKWGNRVFESTELNNGAPVEAWNGRLNNQGEILPMGAYVWKIEATFNDGHVWQGNSYSGENLKRYGTLMLIR